MSHVEGQSHGRELLEVQVRSIVAEPGRLYALLHAIVEECYRRGEVEWQKAEWQQIAQSITRAEQPATKI